ncbi:GNAT family N-acetyltransferase [Gemmatimonadota bacterium]
METAVESKPAMKPQGAKLRDGTAVLIRPVKPTDKSLLAKALEQMSDRSRYHRFAMVVRELSDGQLSYLTEIDNENHVAWVAVDHSEGVERAVGVARYIRLDETSDVAEVAVAVADTHQGRGLGTILLGRLAQSARDNGVRRFLAFVCCDNAPVLKLVRELGARARFLGSGMVRVTGEVPESLDGVLESSW